MMKSKLPHDKKDQLRFALLARLEPGLWTEKTAAKVRGCAVSTLQKERHFHTDMPFVKMGRSVRYVPEDVVNFCLERRIVPQMED